MAYCVNEGVRGAGVWTGTGDWGRVSAGHGEQEHIWHVETRVGIENGSDTRYTRRRGSREQETESIPREREKV